MEAAFSAWILDFWPIFIPFLVVVVIWFDVHFLLEDFCFKFFLVVLFDVISFLLILVCLLSHSEIILLDAVDSLMAVCLFDVLVASSGIDWLRRRLLCSCFLSLKMSKWIISTTWNNSQKLLIIGRTYSNTWRFQRDKILNCCCTIYSSKRSNNYKPER